jgi:outer membrane protein OmpA-like peptidoglycan-associated protein
MNRLHKKVIWLGVLAAIMLVAQGCASKKYVRQQVSPVDQRVVALDQKVDDQGRTIYSLESKVDQNISRMDETIGANTERADEANRRAMEANDAAAEAYGVANEGRTRVAKLERQFEQVHDYRLLTTGTVLFGFDKSELDDDAKASIGNLMRNIEGYPNFVIEVQGFTDKTGNAKYNLNLSESRADSVVRYLNTTYDVPLRSIHKLGVGSADPTADNSTREGRKLNRRVEIRVFAPATGETEAMPTTTSRAGTIWPTAYEAEREY